MSERRDIHVMLEEIEMTGSVIRQNILDFGRILDEKKELFSKTYSKIYAIGCGDSLFTGEAAAWEFRRDTGLPFEAIEALEFCRYAVEFMPANSLVFISSFSGSVARTIEAAYIAKRRGATVVAVTGSPGNKLAKIADNVIIYNVQSLGFAPGTISFTAPLMMLYMCAIKMGACTGKLSPEKEQEKYETLRGIAALADQTVAANKEQAKAIMESLRDRKKFYIIGSGPNYAMARFGAAKFIEGSAIDGFGQSLEEWAHEQYFVSTPQTDTIVLGPAGMGESRVRELVDEMNFIGTGNILITTEDGPTFRAQHTLIIPNRNIEEAFTPLLTGMVVSLLAYYLSEINGKSSYNFKGDAYEEEHYKTLHHSEFCPELRDVDECFN